MRRSIKPATTTATKPATTTATTTATQPATQLAAKGTTRVAMRRAASRTASRAASRAGSRAGAHASSRPAPRATAPAKTRRPPKPLRGEDLPVLGETLDFMRLMWQLDHALQRASKHMERSLRVTGPQRLIVRILGQFPGLPAGRLANLVCLHPSTLTGILQRLQQQRLLSRRRDPQDHRRALLSLTEKGRAVDTASEGTVEFAVRRALSALPSAKVQAAREVLIALAGAMEPEEP